MPLVKMNMRMENIEKRKKNTRVRPLYVVKCTCGRRPSEFRHDLAYIYEEYQRAYRGKDVSHTESNRSTVVCMRPGCYGKQRVAYDPKLRNMKMLTYSEYITIKRAQDAQLAAPGSF